MQTRMTQNLVALPLRLYRTAAKMKMDDDQCVRHGIPWAQKKRPIIRLKIWTERLKAAIATFNLSAQIFSLKMGLIFRTRPAPLLSLGYKDATHVYAVDLDANIHELTPLYLTSYIHIHTHRE